MIPKRGRPSTQSTPRNDTGLRPIVGPHESAVYRQRGEEEMLLSEKHQMRSQSPSAKPTLGRVYAKQLPPSISAHRARR